VCLGKETWRVYKTYTDFKDMHGQLRTRLKKTKRKGEMPKFPSGKMFGADKEDFVKKRKQKLQTYISDILKIPEVMKTGLLTGIHPRLTHRATHAHLAITQCAMRHTGLTSPPPLLRHDRLPEDERTRRHVARIPERGRRFASDCYYSVSPSTRAYAWSHELSQL
jgi:hypothetical protein